MNIYDTREGRRLQLNREKGGHWNRWGPFLSERAWGSVREDYSADGDAWSYFPHDHARSRAYRWSEGRALYAAGVPFPPVRLGDKTLIPGQGNNLYIFPAVGLAIYATRAKRVTDEMFIAAAHAVAEQVTQAELDAGLLYPPQTEILQTEITTAVKVCEIIFARGLAGTGVEKPSNMRTFVEAQLYKPEYQNLI